MKSKTIEIKRGNVVVKIYVVPRVKGGRRYTEYKVADKSTGARRLAHSIARQFRSSDCRWKLFLRMGVEVGQIVAPGKGCKQRLLGRQ